MTMPFSHFKKLFVSHFLVVNVIHDFFSSQNALVLDEKHVLSIKQNQ